MNLKVTLWTKTSNCGIGIAGGGGGGGGGGDSGVSAAAPTVAVVDGFIRLLGAVVVEIKRICSSR